MKNKKIYIFVKYLNVDVYMIIRLKTKFQSRFDFRICFFLPFQISADQTFRIRLNVYGLCFLESEKLRNQNFDISKILMIKVQNNRINQNYVIFMY